MQTIADQVPRLGERELICLLSLTCNYVVFVWVTFLFLCVFRMGCVNLLWHSLSLPYNYFVISGSGFESWIWVVIASVPGLCKLLTFIVFYLFQELNILSMESLCITF